MVAQNILHYRILEKLGQGGMGVVYKAEDTKLKRTVALKFLLPHILSSDEEKNRFIHEAQAAAALHHPNICTIYEINEADDQTFISMAYLEGESLSERIARGPMDTAEAVRICIQVARGLNAAHEKGIVHRDVKSSNIMISADGRATIMDFGLATSARQSHRTKRGTQMGTIGYMSPEQTRGDAVDHRTDIWSLGVLLYEMVTGRRPFRGEYDEAVIYSILNEEPEPLAVYAPDAPEEVWLAVQRAIVKDPVERYAKTAELVEDLEGVYEDIKTGSSSRRRTLRAGERRGSAPVTTDLFSLRSAVVLGLYLVAAWLVVRSTGWAADRFVLSNHLVNIVTVGLISFVPTVWILAARNGAHTRMWSRITRIGIPANVTASIVLLVALFAGRDLGAATETVTVLDEAGHTIERAVPKSEFRKSMLLFFLDDETGETGHEWVGGAVMVLIQVDLFQDQFLYMRSGIDEPFRQRLLRKGFGEGFEIPWTLKRKMAEEADIDYVVTGSYARDGDEWVVTLDTHESRGGRLVSQNVHRGRDLFALADEASVALKRAVGLPERHIERTPDLPIGEMLTASIPALRDFCIGIYVALYEQDWRGSLEYLERAVAADSAFSWGHCVLYEFYTANNVPGKADPAMQAAMRHSYKLPERMQFLLKAEYYQHMQEPEKLLGIVKMWVELYPDDIEARSILARVRRFRNERELAIAEYEKLLDIDPSRAEFLLELAGQYESMGNYEEAIRHYEAYLEDHRDDATAYHELGGVYETQGRYDEARRYYEKAIVLEPNHAMTLVDLADIEAKLGNDERAIAKYAESLEFAKTPEERSRVYRSTRNFYSNRGQMEKCLEQVRLNWAEREKFLAPVNAEIEKLWDLCFFVWAGRADEAFDIIESVGSQLIPPQDGLLPIGYLCIYVELEDPDKTEEALAQLNKFIDTYRAERLRGEACWAEGEMEEARGNYEKAIDCYQRKLKEDPNDFSMHRSIGRCYRKLGRFDEALASIEKMLRVYPNNPLANYEIALAYDGLRDRTTAMRHLRKALDLWKNADPVFERAKRARATLAQWES